MSALVSCRELKLIFPMSQRMRLTPPAGSGVGYTSRCRRPASPSRGVRVGQYQVRAVDPAWFTWPLGGRRSTMPSRAQGLKGRPTALRERPRNTHRPQRVGSSLRPATSRRTALSLELPYQCSPTAWKTRHRSMPESSGKRCASCCRTASNPKHRLPEDLVPSSPQRSEECSNRASLDLWILIQ